MRLASSEVRTILLLSFGKCFLGITLECDELAHQVLVHVHYCRVVVEITAIVLCAEDRNELLILSEEAVAVLHDLMPATYEVQVVVLQELLQLFVAKDLTATSLVFCPVRHIFIRIVPK